MYNLESFSWFLKVIPDAETVLTVKERLSSNKSKLESRGSIHGQSLHRCAPVIRKIVSGVCDNAGIPMGLQRHFPLNRISFRGVLPLNEEAGIKLSLIFILQEGVTDMDQVEIISLRVNRFSKEEAFYWLTRATQYDADVSRWAREGMRIILGGQSGDTAIPKVLKQLHRRGRVGT